MIRDTAFPLLAVASALGCHKGTPYLTSLHHSTSVASASAQSARCLPCYFSCVGTAVCLCNWTKCCLFLSYCFCCCCGLVCPLFPACSALCCAVLLVMLPAASVVEASGGWPSTAPQWPSGMAHFLLGKEQDIL